MIEEHRWGVQRGFNGLWAPAKGYEKHPVVNISWYGANEFAQYYGMRLPTEAEWEYAARGGILSKEYLYAGGNDLEEVGWYDDNSGNTTHAVGQKKANELGLYDMSGNVYEWCWDWYGEYKKKAQLNPTGPSEGSFRVVRGGSWDNFAFNCHSAFRLSFSPYVGLSSMGFRCVCTAPYC